MKLKTAHLVGRCRIGRAFEPGGEPLAAIDVATLRVRVELAGSHVFDLDSQDGAPRRAIAILSACHRPLGSRPPSGLERSDFVPWAQSTPSAEDRFLALTAR